MSKYLIIPTVAEGDVLIPADNILRLKFDGGLVVWIQYQNHKNIPPSYLYITLLCLPSAGHTPAPQATEILKKSLLELLGSSRHTLTVPIKASDYAVSYY